MVKQMNTQTNAVVIIPDFTRVLAMITWVRASHWSYLRNFLTGEEVDDLTRQLYEAFPTLKEYAIRCASVPESYEGPELLAVLADTLEPFLTRLQLISHIKLGIAWATYNDHLEIDNVHRGGGTFGYALPGTTKDDVLQMFSPEEQGLLAIWEVCVPDTQKARLLVGFHTAKDDLEKPALPQDYNAVLPEDARDFCQRFNQMTGGGYVINYQSGGPFAFALQEIKN